MARRQFTVIDGASHNALAGAIVSVEYGIVPCGGPLAFLGGPSYPRTPKQTTNALGQATLNLARDWPFGLIITIDAPRYEQDKIIVAGGRLEGIPFESLPPVVELQPQNSSVSDDHG